MALKPAVDGPRLRPVYVVAALAALGATFVVLLSWLGVGIWRMHQSRKETWRMIDEYVVCPEGGRGGDR